MSSTTLVTFLLQAPLSTFSVNLFGSWDNFKKAYPMQKDSRTGRGHWRGCHSFQNIICDGDSLDATESRDGGLMMGGKYWYYYQLDDDIEYYNPAEPLTTFCPLLPGQEVNVLEVPIEWKSREQHSRSRATSSAVSLVCTLDPEDRYLKPNGPPTTEPPRRATSTFVSNIEQHGPQKSISNQAPLPSPNRPSSRMGFDTPQSSSRASNAEELVSENKTFHIPKLRLDSFWTATRPFRIMRSAFTSHGSELGRKASPGSQRLRPHTSPTIGICRAQGSESFTPARVPSVSVKVEEWVPSVSYSALSPGEAALASISAHETGTVLPQDQHFSDAAKHDVPALDDTSASCGDNADPPHQQSSDPAEWKSLNNFTDGVSDIAASLTTALSQLKVSQLQSDADAQESKLGAYAGRAAAATAAAQAEPDTAPTLPALPIAAAHNMHSGSVATKLYRSSSSQYTMNDLFSPSLSTASAFTGPMSPYHLSQPGTPSVNDFGDDYPGAHDSEMWSSPMRGVEEGVHLPAKPHVDAAPPISHVANYDGGAIKGYSVAAEEQTSPSNLDEPSKQAFGADSPLENKTGKQLVESWNDGSAQRTTGMKELLEDLAYLGGMIA